MGLRVLTICLLVLAVWGFQVPNLLRKQLNGYDNELAKTYVAYGILSYCPKKCL